MRYALWIVQGLLALLFLFAGVMKFKMSVEEMTQQIQMSGTFLRFIGVCEILGGLGLILPSLLRIRPGLTPLAAACLMVIMIGATVVSVMIGGVVMGVAPFVVLLLLAFIAYGRWKLAPIRSSSGSSALEGAR
ncbi:MAG TPA: DoxX family protein [Methylomirabilota bacterium]|nr:DoxX family protein [Methylomirabilota bacterium]